MTTTTVKKTMSLAQHANNVDYRIYTDLTEITGLSRQWEDLLAKSQCNKVFGSPEWYLATCRRDASTTPYVIAATRGSELTGVLPLVLYPAGTAMFPGYATDYNDVLVQGSNPALAADLLRYAISADTSCRHLNLSKLRPDSNCLAALSLVKDELNIECQNGVIDSHFYVQLPSNFDDYLACLGKEFRRNVRRALRAATAGGLTICELYPNTLDPSELPDIFFNLLLCRHIDIESSEQMKMRSFTAKVLPAMFRKGSMRVFAVIEEGRIIAVELVFVSDRSALTWSSNFLTGKEHWSPGTLLYAFAIRQAIAEGLHEVDFGDGDEAYKRHWTDRKYGISEVDLISKR
jgi:CelD/BcsL family acetyltransferase involved in cellulose biosynthesis